MNRTPRLIDTASSPLKNEEFVHLHTHDQYSLLDGLGQAEAWAKRVNELDMTQLASTNHMNVDGVIRSQTAFEELGVRLIAGCECYIVPNILVKEKGEKRYHVTLLVKNYQGWKNLLQMLTQANLKGYYYRPRIDPDILLDFCEGLVVMTACTSSFLNMPDDTGVDLLRQLSIKTDTFIEVMPLQMDDQKSLNERCMTLSREYNIPLVASNDCHYPLAEHSELQEVLLCMQQKKTWKDPDRWKFDIDDLYLKSAEEMEESFKTQGVLAAADYRQAMRNTVDVASLCQFKLEPKTPILPKVYVRKYDKLSEDDQILKLVIDGLKERAKDHQYIADDIDKYNERITDELAEICPKFTRYFLIVWELINWCKENEFLSGPGRGSVGCCLVAYCLGITDVDSLKYDLMFSRFISQGRIDLPDIDMDFEDRRRPEIREHLEEVYGKWNIIEVSNFLTMKGKSAIRDVSRVFSVPLADVKKASDVIVTRSGGDFRSDFSIEDAFDTFEDGIRFKEKYPKVTSMAMELEGQIRTTGRHAAAVCVSQHDLRSGENANFVVRNGHNVCNWEKNDSEFMGLMKLDVLGLNSLTILSESKRLVKERHSVDINFNLIDLDDEKLCEQFTLGNTIGIFQFNSPSMINLCREIHGETFDQIVALNALHRPGALRSGFTQIYRDRKHGKAETTYAHEWIKGITENTQGLIIYQEQVMRLMYELGGLTWRTADTIRKVISKSKGVEEFMKFEQDFINGCEKLGTLSAASAKTIFGELRNTGSYMFNKAHAIEYSMIAVWEMYLKVYYPVEFMAALLSFGPASKKHELINEAKRLGIKIALPDINKSESSTWIIDTRVEDSTLLAPLQEVKGIGEVASDLIIGERENGPYKSPEELESRVPKRKVNKKVRGLLESVLAYDSSDDKLNLSEAELEELSALFDFDLSNDPLHRYRKVIDVIGEAIRKKKTEEKNEELVDTSPIDLSTVDNKNTINDIIPLDEAADRLGIGPSAYFFGKMISLRVGYREAVGKQKTKDGFGSMGGVYGNMEDDTGFKMLVFGNEIYNRKKYTIEHCDDQAVLTLASNNHDLAALRTNDAWFGDEMLSGNLEGLDLNLSTVSGHGGAFSNLEFHEEGLQNCEDCELRAECTRPVFPTCGSMNIMIAGEAPGQSENSQNEGFVGRSGQLLWRIADDYGLDKSMFHVSNVCKCWPSKTRTPKKAHINKCSKWLEKEIELVKPFMILSFGNTGNYFFRGEESGIMSINATTEWNDKYNCWVVYSIHPSMAVRNEESIPDLEKSIAEFTKKISILM